MADLKEEFSYMAQVFETKLILNEEFNLDYEISKEWAVSLSKIKRFYSLKLQIREFIEDFILPTIKNTSMKTYDLIELSKLKKDDLLKIAESFDIDGSKLNTQNLIYMILEKQYLQLEAKDK